MVYGALAGQGYFFISSFLLVLSSKRVRSKTVFGGHGSRTLHDSARFATMKDVKRSGLLSKTGVVVGAFSGYPDPARMAAQRGGARCQG